MIYLVIPYSHPDPLVREARFPSARSIVIQNRADAAILNEPRIAAVAV